MSRSSPIVPGRLFIVATPIGNLEDVTHRALKTLAAAPIVACEDTRVTKKLLSRYEIEPPKLVAIHAHSTQRDCDKLLQRLAEGEDVAYVTDAGTPIVSDPGAELVRGAVDAGIEVIPIPGPSAVTASVSASGIDCSRFAFLGFLPRTDSARVELLAPFRQLHLALVLYDSPNRIHDLLETAKEVLGDRNACIAREMTKKFETFVRGTLSELAEHFSTPPKGEVVLIIAPARDDLDTERPVNLRAELEKLLAAGHKPSEAARLLAGAHGIPKRQAYRMILELPKDED